LSNNFGVEDRKNRIYTHGMATRHNKSAKGKTGKTDPIKAAEEFGIDISALRDNLKLSYEERIRRHQMKLNAMIKSGKPIKKVSDKQIILELEAIKELMKDKG